MDSDSLIWLTGDKDDPIATSEAGGRAEEQPTAKPTTVTIMHGNQRWISLSSNTFFLCPENITDIAPPLGLRAFQKRPAYTSTKGQRNPMLFDVAGAHESRPPLIDSTPNFTLIWRLKSLSNIFTRPLSSGGA